MNSYNDDQRNVASLAPTLPLQPITVQPKCNSFMDYVRNNKVTVLIAALIIIFLLYWFCFRKSGPSTPAPTETKINITAPSAANTVAKGAVPSISINKVRNPSPVY